MQPMERTPTASHTTAQKTREAFFYAVPYEVIKEPIKAPGRATEARKTPRGIEPRTMQNKRRHDPPGTQDKRAGANTTPAQRKGRAHG